MVHEYLINEKEVEIMAENLVNTFVTQVIENSDYEELDRIYLTNKVFTLVEKELLMLKQIALN